MNSATLPSFWAAYNALDEPIKQRARKAYQLWAENPSHPSLQFKCVNREENIWSVRITRNYRAIGVLDNDTVTWFWIGKHDDYQNFLARKIKTVQMLQITKTDLSASEIFRGTGSNDSG